MDIAKYLYFVSRVEEGRTLDTYILLLESYILGDDVPSHHRSRHPLK